MSEPNRCQDCGVVVGHRVDGCCPRMMMNYQPDDCCDRQMERLKLDLAEAKRGLAAWEALAEWGSANDRHSVVLPYKNIHGRWFTYCEVRGSGEETAMSDESIAVTATAAAIDLAVKLGVLDADAGGADK